MYIINIMKTGFYVISFSFFFGFLVECQLVAEGFLHGTQVKTPIGYVAIEELHIHDSVMCCDIGWSLTERSIIALHKSRVAHYIKIMVGDEVIYAAGDQKFYVPKKEIWCEAQALMPGDFLLSNGQNLIVVDDIMRIDQEAILYDVTVDGCHNFCVSSYNIHVHNVIPVITAGIGWIVGLGAAEVAQATLAVVGTAIALMASYNNDKQKDKVNRANFGGQSNNSPSEDPDNKKNKERKLNLMSKREFFESVKEDYEHYRDGVYKKKRGSKGIENAEYLEWDHLHNDVEVYSKGKRHLGSIDPMTKKLYKSAVFGRKLSF